MLKFIWAVVLLCPAVSAFAQSSIDCSTYSAWNASTAYSSGNYVKQNDVVYVANWWTMGDDPATHNGQSGTGQPWTVQYTCNANNKGTRSAAISSPSSGAAGTTIALTYTASPTGGTATWSVASNGDGGSASLSGTTLSLTTAGTVTVTLSIAEDANYNAASVSQTVTIASTVPGADCSNAASWDSSIEYWGGNQVTLNNTLYQAKWYSQNASPATNAGSTSDKPWMLVGTCAVSTGDTDHWKLDGNGNVNSTSFLGTTLATALRFRSNNIEHMRLHPFGTLQIGGNTTADSYYKLDVTGRTALRPDVGPNQNNILVLYSNNNSTTRYTAGFRHYTGFSHVLLGSTEVGVMNTVEYNSSTGQTVGKHLLLQNTAEGNLGIGIFTSVPEARLHVKGNSLYEGIMTVKGTTGLGSDAARFMHPTANSKGEYQYIYFSNRSFTDGTRFGAIGSYEETPSGVSPYSGQPRPLIIQGQDVAGTTYKPYVGIGYHTLPPTEQLSVKGNTIIDGTLNITGNARFKGKLAVNEVFVTHNPLTDAFPDYVFESAYKLPSLKELEAYIKANKHLPGIPSASAVQEAGGFSLGEMNNLMLKKIEELTLYIIEQNKRIEELERKLNESK